MRKVLAVLAVAAAMPLAAAAPASAQAPADDVAAARGGDPPVFCFGARKAGFPEGSFLIISAGPDGEANPRVILRENAPCPDNGPLS